ncbi:FAD-dependent oxidoreductase [Chroococcidiopsis sp. CCALA 051]|uniref:NAD(P)/FAD-dependent oxidoreductase n=1 Tax=Chroococcidiopsis sp. CCALA 051 TaxID=869949 RepID=UPI000D0D707B|nr:FAD-dependent oxidoreductase [Chroococcidiopsis sp. CCALA 051]PSM47592.1 FAD-dependent oxidoreductase [Chroococcidiopsis sp. CCALA 051]
MYDIAVIGAGIAGLACAQQLHQAGYNVLILEKSRGLGGRIATRRLHDTLADHGTCYLKPKGELMQQFVQLLCDRHILQVWTDNSEFRYVAPAGMNAIAKFLGQGLEVWRSQRVEAIAFHNSYWQLSLESASSEATANQPSEVIAKAVVLAIPAPQALAILEPLTELSTVCQQLRSVEFHPCLSVMAGYSSQLEPQPDWQAVSFVDNPVLAWVGWDSSKRVEKTGNFEVFVVQSSADFARRYLETSDLQAAGYELLAKASECLLPWLAKPEWLQVHRWRYAFPSRPLGQSCLSNETNLPLVCCGDWCGGNFVEGAMHSGIAAATEINRQMEGRSLPGSNFLQALALE